MDTTIEEFDYDLMPKYGTTLFVSSRASGKSVMARDMLYYFITRRKITRYIIISATMHNSDYAFLGYGDNIIRLTDINHEILEEITKDQRRRIEEDPDSADLVILMDDLIKSCDQKCKDCISRMWATMRHDFCYLIMITQSFRYECSRSVVLNSDLIILFSSRNIENKKLISSMFLGFTDKDDRDLGYKLIDSVAQGYRAMAIPNTSKSTKINEIVYYKEIDLNHTVPKNYIFS